MARWHWQGSDRAGHCRGGLAAAPSRRELAGRLQAEGITLWQARRQWWPAWRPDPARIDWLARQLATLLAGGVPLSQALRALVAGGGTLAPVLLSLLRQLEAGWPLSVALAGHPALFDPLFCRAVALGEQTGRLDRALMRLAVGRERARRLAARARTAMLYPALVLLLAVAVTVAMTQWVLPTLVATFAEAGEPLPPQTRWLIALVGLPERLPWLLPALLALAVSLRSGLRRTARGRAMVERLLLALPLLGALRLHTSLARWCAALADTLAAGVPLLEALPGAGAASGSERLSRATRTALQRLAEGMGLADALAAAGVFPPLLLQLAAVGESSGALDDLLERAAAHYEEETDRALQIVLALLEPLSLILLAGVCGVLLWALYLPVFRLGQTVG